MPEWTVFYEGDDVVLCGPGGLQIMLYDFDAERLERLPDLPMQEGLFVQRQWRYPLEEGVWLELISTEHATNTLQTLHLLRVGTAVAWQLSEESAELLHGCMSIGIPYK